MIKSIVEHTLGAALMVLVAQIMQVDWQLLMMAFHSATHGRFFMPEVTLLLQQHVKV